MPRLGQYFSNVLITGGSRGFGAAFTEMFLSEGIDVYVLSRTQPAEIAPSPKLHFVPIDLSKEAIVLQWLEKIQQEAIHFDLFINNAGAGAFFPFEDLPLPILESQLQLLKYIGCDKIQGYYISRPVPKNEFVNVINTF